ncbi:MAG: hypothetical protein WC934_04775 [Acidithiobacillus sp.]|jgi:hypothetical protein|uniref:hypothetical protein n=1 Tax=Acidithiobacillus sp. TaxID=1872118 RepID=UPI00355D7128
MEIIIKIECEPPYNNDELHSKIMKSLHSQLESILEDGNENIYEGIMDDLNVGFDETWNSLIEFLNIKSINIHSPEFETIGTRNERFLSWKRNKLT